MITENTEDFVTQNLRSRGLQVKHIQEGATKTPDLLVSDGTCKYLIEIKDKLPNPDKMRLREEELENGNIYNEEEELTHNKRISGVIREGAAQLARFKTEPVDFRLLWLQARHQHQEMQVEQFQSTLYGTVQLLDPAEVSGPRRQCFFFRYAEFFKLRDVLDGAFVATDDRCLLCLNSLSPQFERLTSLQLCQVFPGICDPIDLEQTGAAYIADCNASRKNLAAVLDYVRDKYGRPGLIEFQPKHYSGEISVPL